MMNEKFSILSKQLRGFVSYQTFVWMLDVVCFISITSTDAGMIPFMPRGSKGIVRFELVLNIVLNRLNPIHHGLMNAVY